MECCRLCVKDTDFQRRQLLVHEAKEDKDRAVPLAESLIPRLVYQILGEEKVVKILAMWTHYE